jgi:hypothetical protein
MYRPIIPPRVHHYVANPPHLLLHLPEMLVSLDHLSPHDLISALGPGLVVRDTVERSLDWE